MSTALQAAGSVSALTEDQARVIGVDAYVYFYPLITMDLTRKQSISAVQSDHAPLLAAGQRAHGQVESASD